MIRRGLLVLFLAVCMLITPMLPAYATSFSDLPDTGSYLNNAVNELVAMGVISGFVDGTFRPQGVLTRAQVAKLIVTAKGISTASAVASSMSFTDVPSTHWATPYVKACCASGIVNGYQNSDGTYCFKPEQPITRGELARILRRAMGVELLNPSRSKFSDVSTGYWAFREIETVTYYGVMGGYSDGTFHPAEPASRAQAAVAIYNMLHADLTPPSEEELRRMEKTVVAVDPGHGGKDPGAIASSNGLKEKDVNLAVALKLQTLLKGGGFEVVMTRSSDVFIELGQRAAIANEAGADIFVSIHHNSSSTSTSVGTAVYSHPSSTEGAKLAQCIQEELVKQFGWAGVSGKDDGTKTANFAVLRETLMPAALCESAFLSNPDEAALLATDSFRSKEAQGIYNGIAKYFSQK